MKVLKHILLLTMLFLTSIFWGQATLTTELSQDSVAIGDHFDLTLQLSFSENTEIPTIHWLPTREKWSEEVEVIRLSTDSVNPLKAVYTLTSFDTSYVAIPPIQCIVGIDTLSSEPKICYVFYPEVDLLSKAKDVKPIMEVQVSSAYSLFTNKWFWFFLIVLVLGLLAFWIYWKNRNLEVSNSIMNTGPKLTASDIAYQRLIALQNKDLFARGLVKDHYVELSGIFRNYIEDRFQIPALEETTDQLITTLKSTEIHRGDIGKLKRILELSDMVKFAKAKPAVFDHERSMKDARNFIMNTKIGSADE